ncbi:MAG: protein-disulfide reductase DsbD domain-containing protein, partial [Bacteroidales bacterium]
MAAVVLLLLGLGGNAQMVQPVKWKFSSRPGSAGEVELVLTASIDGGWHIYGQSIPEGGPVATEFAFEPTAGVKLVGGVASEKPAEKVYDKVFSMNIELYERSVTFTQRVQVNAPRDTVRGTVTFMACNDHQCVAPEEVEFAIAVQGVRPEARRVSAVVKPTAKEEVVGSKQPEADTIGKTAEAERVDSATAVVPQVAEAVGPAPTGVVSERAEKKSRSLWGIFLAGILGGFAAFLMPCIFPMLPLTVSYFTKAGKKGKAFGQAALYGGSIVVIYVALGLLVTLLFGADALNDLSTNGTFNLFFFGLLVVFAFSFLGAFELTLPASWSNRLDSKVDGGGMLGIFFMAATLALVSFSCTGPIIGTLLVETASKGEL